MRVVVAVVIVGDFFYVINKVVTIKDDKTSATRSDWGNQGAHCQNIRTDGQSESSLSLYLPQKFDLKTFDTNYQVTHLGAKEKLIYIS